MINRGFFKREASVVFEAMKSLVEGEERSNGGVFRMGLRWLVEFWN